MVLVVVVELCHGARCLVSCVFSCHFVWCGESCWFQSDLRVLRTTMRLCGVLSTLNRTCADIFSQMRYCRKRGRLASNGASIPPLPSAPRAAVKWSTRWTGDVALRWLLTSQPLAATVTGALSAGMSPRSPTLAAPAVSLNRWGVNWKRLNPLLTTTSTRRSKTGLPMKMQPLKRWPCSAEIFIWKNKPRF